MFTEVSIEKIEAKHSVKNIVSCKVLQKAGRYSKSMNFFTKEIL